MWISTSDRAVVLPTALGVLLWVCATQAWTPNERKALEKVRQFAKHHQRHGEVHGHHNPHDEDYWPHPSPLEGPCVDHDAACEHFAQMHGCLDADIKKVCVKSCTSCIPLCIDTGYGCSIIKDADLCNKFYRPICKKTCGVCVGFTGSTSSTTPAPVTTPGPTTPAPTGPTTAAPTGPTTAAPTTVAPTAAPTTVAPTAAPTTAAPTAAPTTAPPTTAPPTGAPIVCNVPTAGSVNTCDFSKFPATHTAKLAQNASCHITKTTISEHEKHQILELHNQFRAKVANGLETKGVDGGQPAGSNIRELAWSEELAYVAAAWAKQCPFLRHDTYPARRTCHNNVVGQNAYYTWSNRAAPVWERAIGRWYTEVKDVSHALVDQYKDPPGVTIGHYTQVIWGETMLIGCGAVSYETHFHGHDFKHAKIYVCNYASAGNIIDQPIYKTGPAATECDDGFIPSTCNPGLCAKEEDNVTHTTTIHTTTPSTGHTTTDGHPSCKFTAHVPALGAACSYTKFGTHHTANLDKNCDCEVYKVGVTADDKQLILKLHNDFRSYVAQGKETRGNPAPQPAGANIKQLVWNDQLAEVAQAWANLCPHLKHDSYANRRTCQYSVVGQNMYYAWSNRAASVWERGIKRWYDEVAKVPKHIVALYAEHPDTIGHYTQMLWAITTEIGCGAVYYRTNFRGIHFNHAKIYVCNYGPAGNVLGRPIYLQGPAATKCHGHQVSTAYPSLCKAMPAGGTTPTSSPVTAGPITSSPGKCLFTAATAAYTSGCDYATRYKAVHTANLDPNCSCEVHSAGLTVPDKTEILKIHNEYRALVASGGEHRGNPGPQPAGANINQLTWSDELAEVAQAWANQCPFLQHDKYADRATCKYAVVGQNTYYTWSNKPESVWARGIRRWYSEVKDLSNLLVDFYAETNQTVGHYTQMLWAKTAQIGCGQVVYKTQFKGFNFKHAKIYVCNYGPAGNILGTPIYEQGVAATKCENQPSTLYPELCHAKTELPGGSRTVRGWFTFLHKVWNPELGDPTSQAFRDLKLLKEMKFRMEYQQALGIHNFVNFEIVSFLEGSSSVIIVADLTVRNFVTQTQIEAATITLVIPGGLDLSNVPGIFIPPTNTCKFKPIVPNLSDSCPFSKFGSAHSVNLGVNCSCEVHKVGVSEADKQIILNRHNSFRTKVAKGLETKGNPGPQPAGANIKELIWSDELAKAAQAWANQCPFLKHDTYANRKTCTFPVVGQNTYYTWSNKPESVWTRGLNRWYHEVKDMTNLLVAFYAENNATIGHYSQMLWAETAQIGCGAVHYKTQFRGFNFNEAKIYVCNYGPAGNILGRPIYIAGTAASKCSAKSTTYPSLCKSSGSTTEPTTTKKPDVCQFTATVSALGAGCNYASFGSAHTANIAKNCKCKAHKAGVTNAEKQEILKVHNEYRSQVARGDETKGNPGPQPAGSNIKELIWNEQLAEIAQRWANQCPFLQHDTYANRRTCNFPVVGQNIYYTWTNSSKPVWTRAIGRWYNEVGNMPKTIVPFYAENKATIGHYTQVLWAESAEIGCGAVTYKTHFRTLDFAEAKIYVCNYGPAGNILGKPVYLQGSSASACATRPSTKYPDLCESSPTSPTVPPVTTQAPGVCKFEAHYETPNPSDCKYRSKYDKHHSINLPKNCSCEVHLVGVTQTEKNLILKLHNTLRSKVARGQETKGDPGPQFKGADLKQLKWSNQLADAAQAWANQCPFLEHDTYANRRTCQFPVVGQNTYYTWSNRKADAWQRGIERWYHEVQNMPNSVINFYAEHNTTIGHYTQLVWAKTTHVGCGAVVYKTHFRGIYFREAKIYVCNYGPAGNILGRPVYTRGKPASKCTGSESTEYQGLCK